jgi:hypothetical protein
MTTSSKRSTEQMHALDIRKLHRKGLLTPGGSFTWQWTRRGNVIATIGGIVDTANSVTLHYRTRRHGGEWQDKRYQVMIDWTPCNYGGTRPWWLCPCCGRRVAVLWGDSTYACRHCQQVNYESTRTAESSKPFERADKLRRRLGWCAGVANDQGDRPRGMHARTYLRLLNELNAHSMAALQSTDDMLKRLKGTMKGW